MRDAACVFTDANVINSAPPLSSSRRLASLKRTCCSYASVIN